MVKQLILDVDGDTKLVENSDDVLHLTFAGSTSTITEFGVGYMNLKIRHKVIHKILL